MQSGIGTRETVPVTQVGAPRACFLCCYLEHRFQTLALEYPLSYTFQLLLFLLLHIHCSSGGSPRPELGTCNLKTAEGSQTLIGVQILQARSSLIWGHWSGSGKWYAQQYQLQVVHMEDKYIHLDQDTSLQNTNPASNALRVKGMYSAQIRNEHV